MSKALDYLLKARPDAMEHYFAFLKSAGGSLDPKTRDLISVITKVANQTEKGFQQYLKRALKDGCSADEVLDALLMAFPVLGLSKIIWAVEQLIAMDLPEFRAENLGAVQAGVKESDYGAPPEWRYVCNINDLPDDSGIRVTRGHHEFFVCRTKSGEVRVYDTHCPHQVTNIPELALDGMILTCPKHGWVFDLENGDCIEKGDEPLKQYKVEIEDGRVLAYW